MGKTSRENQRELFDELGSAGKNPSKSEAVKSFLNRQSGPRFSVPLEWVLITAIVLIIGCVVIFMMGVEKGKQIQKEAYRYSRPVFSEEILLKTALTPPTTAPKAPQPALTAPTPAPISPQSLPVSRPPLTANREPQKVASEGKKPYTIQLAAFRTENQATKEMAVLRTKGYKPRILAKGGYYQVSVGQYQNREEAAGDLKTLKKRYKDCYLRKA